MTWTKLSDDFTDDCWTLSDAAYRLHSDGLVWSNRKLLDCVIPKADVYRFAKRPEAIQELLDAGYWSTAGDAYVIRHHAQYQRQREAVIKQQEANAINGAKGGKARGREQVADLANESPNNSPSESLSESLSERDRPGLALDKEVLKAGTLDLKPERSGSLPESSKVRGLSSMEPGFCHGCGQELDDWTRGTVAGHCLGCSGGCPNCSTEADAAAEPGRCSVAGCAGLVTDYLRREYGPVCFGHVGAVGS